ncbi:MAG: hypothetical protein S4CHLAM102_13920 [Chlamydiia bacterium]|nr:hypothetical protein [Chlamydiia bacterium]
MSKIIIKSLCLLVMCGNLLHAGGRENGYTGDDMATVARFDVCNLDLIYEEEGFQYSMPREMVEKCFDGTAMGQVYTEEEQARIAEDINALFWKIFDEADAEGLLAVMTAGAPGAGKTTVMEQELDRLKAQGRSYAYIDYDQVCLKGLRSTYLADIEAGMDGYAAYTKWRAASHAATHVILANLVRLKKPFFFGTTSTHEKTYVLLDFLRKQGYSIEILHVNASDETRVKSVEKDKSVFVHRTEEDVRDKAVLLPQRILDAVLTVDKVKFFWRDGAEENAVHAATWEKIPETDHGTLRAESFADLSKVVEVHNAAIEKLNKPELSWENTVNARTSIKG